MKLGKKISIGWKVARLVIGVIEDVAEATDKDSDGGKRVTADEIKHIVLEAIDRIGARLPGILEAELA